MAEEKKEQETQEQDIKTVNSVEIADEVVGVIAGIAASEVTGVVTMGGGIVGGISGILGKKSQSRGVKVAIEQDTTTIDLQLVVEYGCRIPEVARQVQDSVRVAVESMTGLKVLAVNIHVQGVSFKHDKKQQPEQEPEDND